MSNSPSASKHEQMTKRSSYFKQCPQAFTKTLPFLQLHLPVNLYTFSNPFISCQNPCVSTQPQQRWVKSCQASNYLTTHCAFNSIAPNFSISTHRSSCKRTGKDSHIKNVHMSCGRKSNFLNYSAGNQPKSTFLHHGQSSTGEIVIYYISLAPAPIPHNLF